jgi:hypothetical protein
MKTRTVEIIRKTDWSNGKQLEIGQVITLGEVDAGVLISLKRAIAVGESPLEGHTREDELRPVVEKRAKKR